MKKIISIVMIALILTLSVSCSGPSTDSYAGKTMNVKAFVEESVLQQIAFKDEHVAASERVLNALYEVDLAKVKSYCVYISGTNSTAEEVAAFEAASPEDIESIKKALDARIAEQKNAYTNYNPVELKKIESAYIASKGSYVVMIVADDTSSAEKLFSEALIAN